MRERKYKKEQNDSCLQMIKSGKSTFSDIEIILYPQIQMKTNFAPTNFEEI